MQKQEEKTKSTFSHAEKELLKKELVKLKSALPEDKDFVLSDDFELIKFLKSNKTFELRHEMAFSELLHELPCEPDRLRKEIEEINDDIIEYALHAMDKKRYLRHRKILLSVGYYFEQLFCAMERRKP
jgi:hypothetical protein